VSGGGGETCEALVGKVGRYGSPEGAPQGHILG
jgi:hypothetical protein